MAKEKLVRLINPKDRSYNGILKNTIIEVPEAEVAEYIGVGFDFVRETQEEKAPAGDEDEGDKAPKKLTRPEIVAALTALGVEFKEVGTSNADLLALLEANQKAE